MSNTLLEFATIAANVLAELASPTAHPDDAAEAMAALEQHVYTLHAEQRYAAQSLCRSMSHAVARRPPADDVECALDWLRRALWWQHQSDLLCVGRCLERAACTLDLMRAPECRVLCEMMRAVAEAVEGDLRGTGMVHGRAA